MASTFGTATASASSTGWAGLWCVNIGYGRNEIADAAHRQMVQLPYYNTFFGTSHPPAIALAEKLAEISPPHMNRVFFATSGSDANDTNVLSRSSLLGRHGPAREDGDHCSRERLPRLHHGRGEPRRHAAHARTGRYAYSGHRSHRAALCLRRSARPGSGCVWSGVRPGARREDRRNLAKGVSPPSSPNRCRAPAALSSRLKPTGRRSSASAGERQYFSSFPTKSICGFGRLGAWFGL